MTDKRDFTVGITEHDAVAAQAYRRDAGFLNTWSSLFVLTTCHTLKMYFLVLVFLFFFYNHRLYLFPHWITQTPYMKMNVTSWQQVLRYIQPQDLDLGQKVLKLLNHVFVICLALFLRCDRVFFNVFIYWGP